ncbi:TPA: hypothetical protein HA265_02105 [Candidatus Woesearchaeota archaeon]|nr:hypothetical protein [Candidatus Woesearchaeota archaeon]
MKKGLGFLIAFLVLFSAFASAEVMDTKLFNIFVEPVQDKIIDKDKDFAEFYIKIENRFTEPETFKFAFLDPPNWKEQILPNPNDRELRIMPGDTGTFHFYVRPSRAVDGVHPVSAILRSEVTGITFRKGFHIQYGEKETPAVMTPPEPDMEVSASVPAKMDPRNPYTVVVNIKNNNERFLENVSVTLDSTNIKDTTSVDVDPDESKGISFAVLFNKDLPPQKDSLHVVVAYQGQTFHDEYHNFEVVEYLPPFDIDVDVQKKLWKRYRTVTITNDGNTEKSDVVRMETSLRERLFSSSVPKYKLVKEEDRQFMTWDVTLAQGASTEIKIKTNYRWLFWIILAILLYFAYLIKKLNPVVVKKKFKSIKKQHGAVSEMAVAIFLKNTSDKPVTNIRVIERITKMVALKGDSFEGSMHPTKMHAHGSEGTIIEYRFAELGPGDERIITYKAFSKLHIFGVITIKPTVVEFKKKSGATMKSRSNQISIQTEAPEERKPSHEKHESHHRVHEVAHKK